ncbi:AraC family transcriptional regulator [Paenibacillus sp. LPE1-1-1.1]|uniref:AraC family transcriptional regulator n=1 Tax=Paenibacillus sp. LPE1-1-1.1 TaxID=3135230 RepID=UPI00342E8336
MAASFDFFYQATRMKNEWIAPHHHPCYELVYYVSGQGQTRIGKKDYSFNAGDYAIINPSTIHEERHEWQSKVMFCGFASNVYPPLVEGIYHETSSLPMGRLMRAIANELRDKKPFHKQMLDNLVSHLYLELLRAHPSQVTEYRTDVIQYAQTFINEYFMHKIDFRALAAQSGYSYDRFRHLFKIKVGASPIQYILERRIEHAKAMLRHTHMQVSVIAMECGFSTDAQFCSMFKRETGITPIRYRESACLTSPDPVTYQ